MTKIELSNILEDYSAIITMDTDRQECQVQVFSLLSKYKIIEIKIIWTISLD